MKKLALTALVLVAPVTLSKPSFGQRAYNFSKGTASLTLLGLGLYAGCACVTSCLSELEEDKVKYRKLAVASYLSFLFAGTIGAWKIGSSAISSFGKAFASSDLLEVTRANYAAEVMESDKPVILAVLPEAAELQQTVYATLEKLQEELGKTYTFGTINLHEAYQVLGIKTSSVIFIKNGNLIANNEGIYNEAQLRDIIKRTI